ncbi:hypothetical protein QFC22_006672 [Naganishia vaughanmartiniae]|uniref:Uncharacterized protein n=1 Tax=Naganishia vaughanmartiniae TaxID=1424756 RepID=A0ACC2WJ14_9TREE|nr:hypothetical protein QFC22_006672 [Naganishia vaughanmartiniae]
MPNSHVDNDDLRVESEQPLLTDAARRDENLCYHAERLKGEAELVMRMLADATKRRAGYLTPEKQVELSNLMRSLLCIRDAVEQAAGERCETEPPVSHLETAKSYLNEARGALEVDSWDEMQQLVAPLVQADHDQAGPTAEKLSYIDCAGWEELKRTVAFASPVCPPKDSLLSNFWKGFLGCLSRPTKGPVIDLSVMARLTSGRPASFAFSHHGTTGFPGDHTDKSFLMRKFLEVPPGEEVRSRANSNVSNAGSARSGGTFGGSDNSGLILPAGFDESMILNQAGLQQLTEARKLILPSVPGYEGSTFSGIGSKEEDGKERGEAATQNAPNAELEKGYPSSEAGSDGFSEKDGIATLTLFADGSFADSKLTARNE